VTLLPDGCELIVHSALPRCVFVKGSAKITDPAFEFDWLSTQR